MSFTGIKTKKMMTKMKQPKIEVADVFNLFGDNYLSSHKLSHQQMKAFWAIRNCRTSIYGGHVNECPACGYNEISYNSCGNRHCPKCQHLAKEKWLVNRKSELLPVKYFHIVFTVPHSLNELFLYNKTMMYNILFKTAWDTIKTVAANKDYIGAETGCTGILHTWGQNLEYHPHVHFIVPAGGLKEDLSEWVFTHNSYFAPHAVMVKLFRGKFLDALNNIQKNEQLEIHKGQQSLKQLLNELYQKRWVVNIEKPFTKPQYVIDYLGNYTHRVAISNYRLVKIENGMVFFRYKDYRNNSRKKIMKLSGEEFIRRFLMHVLPERFSKIRYFGLFTNRFRTENIRLCRDILSQIGRCLEHEVCFDEKQWEEILKQVIGQETHGCPKCGFLMRRKTIQRGVQENTG
jgi:hypothetical protein